MNVVLGALEAIRIAYERMPQRAQAMLLWAGWCAVLAVVAALLSVILG